MLIYRVERLWIQKEFKTKFTWTLKRELELETYRPSKLTKFTIRDPKTRLIRKSVFKDRIVHHAIVNILEPIYESRFIADNFANRLNKGTIFALEKLDKLRER